MRYLKIMIGLITAMAATLATAQPTALPKDVRDKIMAVTQTEKGTYLGLATSQASPAMREQLKLKPGIGLVVERVDKESPAALAGVKQYDILQKLDDQWLVNPDQMAVLVRMHEPDSQITLSIIRQGQPQTLTAKVVEKEVRPLNSATLTLTPFDKFDTIINRGLQGGTSAELIKDGAGAIRINADQMSVVSKSGDNIFRLTKRDNSTRLNVTDTAGKTLFDGPIDTEQQQKMIPEEFAPFVKQMQAGMKSPPASIRITSPSAVPTD